MITAYWAAKGGVGATAVTVGMASFLSKENKKVCIVDLAGDLATVLGVTPATDYGISEWMQRNHELGPAKLRNVLVQVTDHISLLPLGKSSVEKIDLAAIQEALNNYDEILVDLGTNQSLAHEFEKDGVGLIAVLRNCYIALARLSSCSVKCSGALVVLEGSRALNVDDVRDALGIPVVAEIPCDPAIARAVDAGILHKRLPRSMSRAFASLNWVGK